LLFLTVKQPVSLYRLGLLMQALGAYHAVAMDGGTSTAMSFGGRVIASPGRPLTNLLLIYARRDRYERAKQHLVPPRRGAPIILGETSPDVSVEEDASADPSADEFSAQREAIPPEVLPELPLSSAPEEGQDPQPERERESDDVPAPPNKG
jgi:Phosphodiester glycosidase